MGVSFYTNNNYASTFVLKLSLNVTHSLIQNIDLLWTSL